MIARARTNVILLLTGITAALVCGTLFPFSGWVQAPGDLWDQFFAPAEPLRPSDIFINVAVYLPLGFVLARFLSNKRAILFPLFVTVIYTALLSTSLELLQGYLPSRVCSFYDVIFNVVGASTGAIFAMKFAGRNIFAPFASDFRERDGLPTVALFVVGSWIVAELIPFVPSFAAHNVQQGFEPLSLLFNADVPFLWITTASYAGGTIAVAAVLHELLRTETGRSGRVAAIIAGVLALKILIVGRHLLPEQLIGAAIGFGMYKFAERFFFTRLRLLAMIGIALLLVAERYEDIPVYFNAYPIEGQLVNAFIALAHFTYGIWPYCGLAFFAILVCGQWRRLTCVIGLAAVTGLSVAPEMLVLQTSPGMNGLASVVFPIIAWSVPWLVVDGSQSLVTGPTKGAPGVNVARRSHRGARTRNGAVVASLMLAIFAAVGWVSSWSPTVADQRLHGSEMHRVIEPFHRPPVRFAEFRLEHPRLPYPGLEDLDRLRAENPGYIERRRRNANRDNARIEDTVFSAIVDPGSQDLDAVYRRLLSLEFADRGHTQVEPLAIAYDWLYEQWTPQQRARLGEKLLDGCEYVINLIREQRLSPYNVYLYNRPLQALVACAIAGYNETPRSEPVMQFTAALWHERVLPVWRQIMGQHGGWHEGGEYVGIGIGSAIYQIPAMWRHATGVDLFRTEPGIAGFLDFLAYRTRPDGTYIRLGDAGYFDRASPDRTALAVEFGRNPRYETGDCPVQKLVPLAWPWGPLADSSSCERPIAPRPLTKRFDGIGLVIARSDWSPDATYVTFKAGDNFWSHSHLDQGAFTIFKRHALAIDSGVYGPRYGSDHHMNYTYQTIAHNLVTVTDPADTVPAPRKDGYRSIANDGGQRRIGSGWGIEAAPLDLDEWKEKRDIYHTGKFVHFEDNTDYTIATADLTPAYTNALSGTGTFSHRTRRVEKYLRTFIYDRKLDCVAVYDRIRVPDPGFVVRWLLHTQTEPVITANGFDIVVESRDGRDANVRSGLRGHVALPLERRIRRVGGPGLEFYVDGKNYAENGKVFEKVRTRRNMEPGNWRIELQPQAQQKRVSFLVFMFPWSDREPVDDNVDCVQHNEQIVCTIHNLGRRATYAFSANSNDLEITHD